MTIESADDGASALRKLDAADGFDLVLLDFEMPGMDGRQVAAALRARHGDACPPIILLTSGGPDGGAADLGIRARLSKPIKPRELSAAMGHVLGTARTSSGAQRPASPFDRDLARRHPLRILVAEDNPVNQKVLALMLKRFGYGVDAVANGLEAVRYVEEHPCDLVIMDVQMPEMDGLEATRRIRSRRPASAPPYVLALTANAAKEDHEACLDAGMHAYLSKPIQPDDLAEALARVHAWRAAFQAEPQRA
jgi:CheY-like chemotaxis protein